MNLNYDHMNPKLRYLFKIYGIRLCGKTRHISPKTPPAGLLLFLQLVQHLDFIGISHTEKFSVIQKTITNYDCIIRVNSLHHSVVKSSSTTFYLVKLNHLAAVCIKISKSKTIFILYTPKVNIYTDIECGIQTSIVCLSIIQNTMSIQLGQ